MEERKKCGGCGCGKNRSENRILAEVGGREISNRDIKCRDCTYKKKGDTVSCFMFDPKPDEVMAGGNCEKYLKDDVLGKKQSCGGCGNCC